MLDSLSNFKIAYTTSLNAVDGSVDNIASQIYYGNLYIIPSAPIWLTKSSEGNLVCFFDMIDCAEFFGEEETVLCLNLQVQIKNFRNDSAEFDRQFSTALPIRYFFEKKEGDIVEISSSKKKQHFYLKCLQYSFIWGINFETMIGTILKESHANLLKDSEQGFIDKEHETRLQIINKMNQMYFPETKMPIINFHQLHEKNPKHDAAFFARIHKLTEQVACKGLFRKPKDAEKKINAENKPKTFVWKETGAD